MLGKLLLILFSPALLSAPATRPTVVDDFGNISYKTPSGWVGSASGGQVKLTPGKLGSGQVCEIVLHAPAKKAGSFSDWFASTWKKFVKPYSVQAENPLINQKDDQGNDSIVATASLASGDKAYLAIFVGVDSQSTFHSFSFQCSAEVFDEYKDEAESFFKGITFKESGKPAEAITAAPAKTDPLPAPAPMPPGTLAAAAKELAKQVKAGSMPALLRAMLASGVSIKNVRNEVIHRPEKEKALGFAVNAYDLTQALADQQDGQSFSRADHLTLVNGPTELQIGLTVKDIAGEIAACSTSSNVSAKFWGLFTTELAGSSEVENVSPVYSLIILTKQAHNFLLSTAYKKRSGPRLAFAVGSSSFYTWTIHGGAPQYLTTDGLIDTLLSPPEAMVQKHGEVYKEFNQAVWDRILELQKDNPAWRSMSYADYITLFWLGKKLAGATVPEVSKGERLIRARTQGKDGATVSRPIRIQFAMGAADAQAFNARAESLGLKSQVMEGITYLSGEVSVVPKSDMAPGVGKRVKIVNPTVAVQPHQPGKIDFKGAVQERKVGLQSPPEELDWFYHVKVTRSDLPPSLVSNEFRSVLSTLKRTNTAVVNRLIEEGKYQKGAFALGVTDWTQPGWSGSVSYSLHGQASGKDWSTKVARTGALEFVLNDGLPRFGFPIGLTRAEMDEPGRFYTWRASDSEGLATINDHANYAVDDACVDSKKKMLVSITDVSKPAKLKSRDFIYLMLDNVAKRAYFKVPNLNNIPYVHTMKRTPPPKGAKPDRPEDRTKDIFAETKYSAMGQVIQIPWSMIESGKVEVDFKPDPDPVFVNYGSKPITAKLTIKVRLTNTSGS